jgi:hypothetical protein
MNPIRIQQANYLRDYKIVFQFNDGTQQMVDFNNYLNRYKHPQYKKYKNKELFKTFEINNGDSIFWGRNWDLCFNSTNLYYNDLEGFYDNYERGYDSLILVK